MLRVAIGSAFRNSAARNQLTRYFRQVDALRTALQSRDSVLRLIAVEGDSIDNTRQQLMRMAEYANLPIELHIREHGCREWGSTEEPERLEKLSYVANGIFEGVYEHDDVLIYVESDLIWHPEVFLRLIDQLKPGVDVIAPMTFAGEAFYDIWGFRKNGVRFGPFEPFHKEINLQELNQVDSVGSCLVMRAEVARRCRATHNMALVGFCQDVWDKGFTVNADPRERIYHP